MGVPAIGDVVIVAFPYADFSRLKKRPALVVGSAEFGNLILCQITSQRMTSRRAIPLAQGNFSSGGLRIHSFTRPDKLFTVEPSVIEGTAGRLTGEKLAEIRSAIRALFD